MYYFVYGLLYLVSLLPLQVLYLISDFAYFLIYRVIGYRKEVVKKNLLLAFPDKSEKERNKIARKFYRNFSDTFIESIKMISSSSKFIEKRVTGNWDVLNREYDSGRKAQLHLGHNFNWEWANDILAKNSHFPFLAVYMPIKNKIFERIFFKLRSRSGTILLPATKMREAFLPYRDSRYLLGLAADQSPGDPSKAYWINFFGKATPFVKGPEKGAKMNNTLVFFLFIQKLKRGHYSIRIEKQEIDPRQLEEGELTKMFVQYLEKTIRQHPDMWLWSHRRWKHEWKPEYGERIG